MLTTKDRRLGTKDRRTVPPKPKVADTRYLDPAHTKWAKGVKERAGWKCESCGSPGPVLYADHIVELEDGGAALDPRNGRCLCAPCHGKKTAEARATRIARIVG